MAAQTNPDHSVTQYIEGLRNGEAEAAQQIWERFLQRLIRLANKKLSANRGAADEEDLVQQAFAQFFRQVQEGRFPQLIDRDDLWQILAMLVDRRAADQYRRQHTQKAGVDRVQTESILMQESDQAGLAGLPGLDPTPELAAELTELLRIRLTSLKHPAYQQIALLKLQGFSNREIAEQLETSLRTVERRLEHIRTKWSFDLGHLNDE